MDPFLTLTQFEGMFPRELTAAEQVIAPNLLAVASNWIWNRIPSIASDDPAAITVTFEAARDAILYGPISRLEEFQNVTSHRTESGTATASLVEQFITDRHARMLGISLKASPSYNFTPCQPAPGSWAAAERWEYM
jgi:hypothetical protein